jgi:hypothetical protein
MELTIIVLAMFNPQESVAVNPHDFVRQVNARQADTEGLSVIAKITSGFGNGGGDIDDPQAAALNQLQEDYARTKAKKFGAPLDETIQVLVAKEAGVSVRREQGLQSKQLGPVATLPAHASTNTMKKIDYTKHMPTLTPHS